MTKMKKFLAANLVAVVLLTGCGSVTVTSLLVSVAKWAPVGESVFEGIVGLVAPGQSAKLDADAAAVAKAFLDLGSVKTGSGAVADLQAISSGTTLVLSDLSPMIPAQDEEYAQAANAILATALAVYETQFGSATPATTPVAAVRLIASPDKNVSFQSYGDGSIYVFSAEDASDIINYASGGQAALAHPTASTTKVPKLGSFKKQYNAVAKKYGKKQLSLSMAEKLGLK